MTKSGMLMLGLLSLLVIAISCQSTVNEQSAGQELDRTILPIPDPEYPAITELDARKAQAPPLFAVEAPEGAPNVVVVLIDDIGFGAASMFGGSIQTPTLDRLAQGGLRYNQFHTTALCSPTRMAILTGRNHHSANAGSVMEVATAFPGNQGQTAAERRTAGRDAAAERLQHGGVRQVPRDRAVGGERFRPVRPLADAFRLRQVLRLHRRRDQPMGAAHLRWHHEGRGARRSRLPLHHRHDGPGDYLDAVPAVAHA